MIVVRRRLFWKIYITLLASLVAATLFMGAFFWLLGETQRESPGARAARRWPAEISLYAAEGKMIGARGRPIALSDYAPGRHWGPGHVLRIDLPDGRFVLTRFGPPARVRAFGLLAMMLVVAGGVGLAAYPVTALLTRRLETLRSGVAQWGDTRVTLDERGSDEVALLAKTFNVASSRLDAMLASQKALLANASHELRSPLARLRLAIEVGPYDKAGASHAEIVQNLAEMDQLVDELLLSSRLDHPEAHQDRREAVDILGLAAEEGARYEAIVTGESVEVFGDPILLRRMIRNLLENSAKHGRPPIAIAVTRCDGGAEIIVSDAGDGVRADERARLFEPFYRPRDSREASGGWGVGLALVRQIAERHGGSAECRDAPSGGSRFVVNLRPANSRV